MLSAAYCSRPTVSPAPPHLPACALWLCQVEGSLRRAQDAEAASQRQVERCNKTIAQLQGELKKAHAIRSLLGKQEAAVPVKQPEPEKPETAAPAQAPADSSSNAKELAAALAKAREANEELAAAKQKWEEERSKLTHDAQSAAHAAAEARARVEDLLKQLRERAQERDKDSKMLQSLRNQLAALRERNENAEKKLGLLQGMYKRDKRNSVSGVPPYSKAGDGNEGDAGEQDSTAPSTIPEEGSEEDGSDTSEAEQGLDDPKQSTRSMRHVLRAKVVGAQALAQAQHMLSSNQAAAKVGPGSDSDHSSGDDGSSSTVSGCDDEGKHADAHGQSPTQMHVHLPQGPEQGSDEAGSGERRGSSASASAASEGAPGNAGSQSRVQTPNSALADAAAGPMNQSQSATFFEDMSHQGGVTHATAFPSVRAVTPLAPAFRIPQSKQLAHCAHQHRCIDVEVATCCAHPPRRKLAVVCWLSRQSELMKSSSVLKTATYSTL